MLIVRSRCETDKQIEVLYTWTHTHICFFCSPQGFSLYLCVILFIEYIIYIHIYITLYICNKFLFCLCRQSKRAIFCFVLLFLWWNVCFCSPVRHFGSTFCLLFVLSNGYRCSSMFSVSFFSFFPWNFNLFNIVLSFWFSCCERPVFSSLCFIFFLLFIFIHKNSQLLFFLSFSFSFLFFVCYVSLFSSLLFSKYIYSVLLHHSTRCITKEK